MRNRPALALLAALFGSLLLAARLLAAPTVAIPAGAAASLATLGPSRLLGQRALLMAPALAALGIGLAVTQGLGLREDALASGAGEIAALVGLTGLLATGLALLLGDPIEADANALDARAAAETRLAVVLAALAVAAAGLEGWLRDGTYGTPVALRALAALLLGLAALEPTQWSLARRGLLLAGLLAAGTG